MEWLPWIYAKISLGLGYLGEIKTESWLQCGKQLWVLKHWEQSLASKHHWTPQQAWLLVKTGFHLTFHLCASRKPKYKYFTCVSTSQRLHASVTGLTPETVPFWFQKAEETLRYFRSTFCSWWFKSLMFLAWTIEYTAYTNTLFSNQDKSPEWPHGGTLNPVINTPECFHLMTARLYRNPQSRGYLTPQILTKNLSKIHSGARLIFHSISHSPLSYQLQLQNSALTGCRHWSDPPQMFERKTNIGSTLHTKEVTSPGSHKKNSKARNKKLVP